MKRLIYCSYTQDEFDNLMSIYGLSPISENTYLGEYMTLLAEGQLNIEVNHVAENDIVIYIDETIPEGTLRHQEYRFEDVDDVIMFLDVIINKYDIDIESSSQVYDILGRQQVILAARSSKDITKDLVRVKSSNIWAYAINVKEYKDKTGDVVCQFKGKNGGPGDIYMYFDVPVNLWRKWLGAPSKGHFFWKYIRNNFMYRKLTGDKKGKLKNAVN